MAQKGSTVVKTNRYPFSSKVLNLMCVSRSVVSGSLRPHGLPPGSSVHGISQARILEWVTISFSRGSSRPRDQAQSPALWPDSLQSGPPVCHCDYSRVQCTQENFAKLLGNSIVQSGLRPALSSRADGWGLGWPEALG